MVALVTGAAQGIGRGVALRLASDGAALACADVDLEGARQTVDLIERAGGRGAAFAADVSSSEQVRAVVEQAAAELGPISVLVNVAGIYGRHDPVNKQDLDNWQRVLSVNLHGTFRCCRAVLPDMIGRRWGRIVNISSGQGLRPRANIAPYAASKSAVIAFTKSLALEVAEHGITVNAIMPGVTDTAMPRLYGSEEHLQERARTNPLGRIGQPSDIAAAIAFLVSPDADYVTGQTLAVNGGIIMLP
jgi:NAD(P)-dependent dehydrogenase (short-subunit alcohol dehydrogenase family)